MHVNFKKEETRSCHTENTLIVCCVFCLFHTIPLKVLSFSSIPGEKTSQHERT